MAAISVALVLLVGSFLCGASLTRCAVYTVGDDKGWTVGVNYTKWASNKTFYLNDTLVFNFIPNDHFTVVQVPRLDFERCYMTEAIHTYRLGHDRVNLTSPGDVYYMCLNTTYCIVNGLKFHITVLDPNNVSSPKSSPSPLPSPVLPPAESGPMPSPRSGPSPAPASTWSGPSPAPASTGSSPSPSISMPPASSPAPTSSRLGPSPSPSSTGSGPSPPSGSSGAEPSSAPEAAPADDGAAAAPPKSDGAILRGSKFIGLVLGLAIVLIC